MLVNGELSAVKILRNGLFNLMYYSPLVTNEYSYKLRKAYRKADFFRIHKMSL